MNKIVTSEFLAEKNKTDSVFHLIDYLSGSDNICPSCSSDDYILRQREYRFVDKSDLPSVYFDKMDMKEGDSPLFTLHSDNFVCLITEKGEIGKLFYNKNKGTTFFQEKDEKKALSFLIRIANMDIAKRLKVEPIEVVNRDFESRKRKEEVTIIQKIDELRVNQEDFPEDFWESIEHVYNNSSNLKEFKRILKVGDARALDCRPLQRLQRATSALTEPSKESDEQEVIYRALPCGELIEEGDWVSRTESYASSHEYNSENSVTISEVVYSDEIYSGGAPDEEIYVPRGTWKGAESIEDVWDMVNNDNKPKGESIVKRSFEEIMAEKKESSEMSL